MHGTPDVQHRHLPALEADAPASMGKLRVPCDIIMKAFVAGWAHSCWILVSGYWWLVTGYGSLVAGEKGCKV